MLPSLYKNIILQKENTVHLFKNTYTTAQPKPGFVMDYSVYNVATYEGNSGTSGVSLFSVSRGKKTRRTLSHGREVTGGC